MSVIAVFQCSPAEVSATLFLNQNFYMLRTLRYRFVGNDCVKSQERAQILRALRDMNDQFSWSHDKLQLSLYDSPKLEEDVPPSLDGQPVVGRGQVAVGGDEYNAMLVIEFLTWTSTIAPGLTIAVYDEGTYVQAQEILIERGSFRLDFVTVDRFLSYAFQERSY